MEKGDRSDLKMLGLLLAAALGLILLVLVFGGPLIQGVAAPFAEGVGLKTAAVWAFGQGYGTADRDLETHAVRVETPLDCPDKAIRLSLPVIRHRVGRTQCRRGQYG